MASDRESVSPMYLFANLNFVPGRYDDWQAAYDKLGEYVFANEPETRTYYFGIPIDYSHDHSATINMLAVEVYGKWSDLYETHFHSPAMGQFLKETPETMSTGFDLNHYRLIGGNLDFPTDQTECAVMLDIPIRCNSSSDRNLVLGRLETLGKQITNLESSNQIDILTWIGLASLDDDLGLRIYARFETRDQMEAYLRLQRLHHFWFQSKDQIRSVVPRSYQPNGKGWLHR